MTKDSFRKQNLVISKEEFLDRCSEFKTESKQVTNYNDKYNNKCIGILYDVFNDFGGRIEYEAKVGIATSTFHEWQKVHPEFDYAYETIKKLSYSQWEKLPLKEKDINLGYWTAIMRNRFNFGKPRIKKADGKKPLEIVDKALSSLKEGGVSVKEVEGLTSIAERRVELETKLKVESQQENLADRLTKDQRLQLREWLEDKEDK